MKASPAQKLWKARKYDERIAYGRNVLGNKCVSCGSAERLEFDHINPATKYKSVAALASGRVGLLNAELAKCQLLCHACHLAKTRRDYPQNFVQHHGIGQGYRRGCRCRPCKDAHAARMRRYLTARRASA